MPEARLTSSSAGARRTASVAILPPADGYTLLELGSPNFINATLNPDPNFDLIRDIVPVAGIGRNPFVMVVNPDFPAKNVPEFIAYAKANPGKINMTSTGTGNLTHFAGELFKMLAGVDMVHVPGHGEMEAQTDLLAGRAEVMFDPIVSTLGYVQSGKLRALGVTTATPIRTLPDVPTIGQFVPGYEVDAQLGIGAPKGTPKEILEYLNGQINAGLADPTIKERLVGLGFVPMPESQAQFGRYMTDETEKWAKVVKFAGVKLE